MGKFKEWKDRRKTKREEKRDPYDKMEVRLQLKLLDLEPGTEEFKECQAELKNIVSTRSESKESKRRIAKGDRGGIIVKTLGILGTIAGVVTVARYEREGMVFTGEKRTWMDSLVRTMGNFLHR